MTDTRKQFDVVVLGAGVVGVTTAYWAQQAGLSVVVVDRQPDTGLETSYANGGQVAVSHAEPWANPAAPQKILKWLFDREAPLLFRPRLDWTQWWWIAAFLTNCTPRRTADNIAKLVRLGLESRDLLQDIRQRETLEYDQRTAGILHFYRNAREFEAALHTADIMRRHGCQLEIIDQDRLTDIDPAFVHCKKSVVGGTYSAADESGDAFKFTRALARVCESRTVKFLFGSEAVALHRDPAGKRILGVEIASPDGFRTLSGRDVVVCLGSYSAPFLRPYGIRLNIYPAKGYSVTIPTDSSHSCPTTSLTDDEHKLVYSNLGDRLRVAGTAELSGYGRQIDYRRCDRIVENVRGLFPMAGDFNKAQFWAGLRPATPSNLPYLGATVYDNLWLNTGHGTLGWTLAPGNAKRVVKLITDRL